MLFDRQSPERGRPVGVSVGRIGVEELGVLVARALALRVENEAVVRAVGTDGCTKRKTQRDERLRSTCETCPQRGGVLSAPGYSFVPSKRGRT